MKPSLHAITWNDWPALASAIGVIFMWVVYFAYPLVKASLATDPYFIFLPIISTAVLLGILAWRYCRVVALFKSGIETPGEITSIRLVKDRGRVEFSFQFHGQAASSWSPIHKTKRVLALRPGQRVAVLVHPENPGLAILKEIYL